MPLMAALAERHSSRSFSRRALSRQVLSNLLWAACGVNRGGSGRRTAPSAVNWQEIDLYVAMKDGVYLYQARPHALNRVLEDDIRPAIGIQPFPKAAPVILIYVADFRKMKNASRKDREFYSATDVGFIGQNVYLYAASEKLSTVVLGLIHRKELTDILDLMPDQKVLLAQPVGYPPGT